MAFILNTVSLDLTAGITVSFEGRGLIRGGLIGDLRYVRTGTCEQAL